MKHCLYLLLFCMVACQMDKNENSTTKKKIYKLSVNPVLASQHRYNIENETVLYLEVDGQEVKSLSKSNIELTYTIDKDSLDNNLIDITYDKIQLYTKNGEQETNLDADKAAVSINPVEKILGYLKSARLTAVVDAKGETKEIRGYKELGDKILASFAENDTYGKVMAQKQWEGTMRKQLVDENLKQLFNIFPDSVIQVGKSWKITSRHQDQFNLLIDNTFTLKEIENNVATINVTGKIYTVKGNGNLLDNQPTADLHGDQEGTYKVDIKSGMPVSTVIHSNAEGSMQTQGREIPIVFQNKITITRRN